MFIRKIKSKNKTYVTIVKSYRENGVVKQKNIASLGCLDQLKERPEQIKNIALTLLEYCESKINNFDIMKSAEMSRKKWGCVRVYRKLWDTFGFDDILAKIIKDKKIKFDFFSSVFLMLIDRLQDPKSKLASYNYQEKYHEIKKNGLQHLYRALDILSDNKEEIEKYLFYKNVHLFNMEVDVCLYDVTTMFFESVKANELSKFGYSKDCKFNEVQIVIGLLVDLEGRPIGFDVYPGNTYEGHTIDTVLEKLKTKFKIRKIILIGDQAMCTKDTIEKIKGKDFSYIVGSRIKIKGKEMEKTILDIKSYKDVVTNDEEDVLKYKVIELEDEKIICTWSSRREKKNKKDRERLIEKAKKLLDENKSQLTSKRGAMKYIDVAIEGAPELNEEKIKEDERWDGFYGIQTNCEDYDTRTVLGYYHDLWRIEESFRIFKSHLETRPIFHWTAKRIQGHLVLCFIAFLLERTLENKLKKNNIEYSPIKIRAALDELEFSEIDVEGKKFYLRSKVEGLGNKILRSLRLNIPPAIATPDKF